MEQWIALLGDICVILFDLLLYVQMTALRKNSLRNRAILLVGCAVIVLGYFAAVYVFSWPPSAAAFACMTLPSLALFWVFSKYRDARFFLTFCFVDTLSLVVGFLLRYIGLRFGNGGGVASIVAMLLCFAFLYRAAKPYFKKYREMLDYINTGWKRLTFSMAAIYLTIIIMDMNQFKYINDTWGHSTGDQVLKHAAERMNQTFSEGDSKVFRIGGDEFAALAVGLQEDAILKKLKDLEKGQCGEVSYTISYGYAFVNRLEKNAVEQAFSRADRMMYSRKSLEERIGSRD